MKRFLLLLSLGLSFAFTYAQNQGCGTPKFSDEYMAWKADFQQSNTYQEYAKTSGGVTYIPVQVHIVRETDGTGGIKKADVFQRICELNTRYDSTGFYFYLSDGMRVINNSTYYRHNFFQGQAMMFQNNFPNALNMYFVDDAAGNCGYFSPGGDAVAITNSCAGPNETTITHEVGHYFGLPHTFYGWEGGTTPAASNQEKVDGSNCLTAADGFCDTPPDYEWDRWQCSNPPTFTDPNGVSFQPDGTLYMSYSNDACTERFSPNQRTYMNNYLNNSRSDLLTGATPSSLTVGTTTFVSPTSGATVSPNNTTFTWRAAAGATHYHLLVGDQAQFVNATIDEYVTDTFYTFPGNLLPTTQYIFQVKPYNPFSTCQSYTPLAVFTTDTLMTIGITKPMLSEGISLFPNPIAQGTSLMLKFDNEAPSDFTFEMYDLLGKQVFAKEVNQHTTGRTVMPLPTLDMGMYMVRIETKQAIYTDKVIIRN